jgi:hypothetical protein
MGLIPALAILADYFDTFGAILVEWQDGDTGLLLRVFVICGSWSLLSDFDRIIMFFFGFFPA